MPVSPFVRQFCRFSVVYNFIIHFSCCWCVDTCKCPQLFRRLHVLNIILTCLMGKGIRNTVGPIHFNNYKRPRQLMVVQYEHHCISVFVINHISVKNDLLRLQALSSLTSVNISRRLVIIIFQTRIKGITMLILILNKLLNKLYMCVCK